MRVFDIDKVKQTLSDVPSKHLIRLIYISDVVTTDKSVFEHIQRHSTTFNKHHNITGFLCNDAKSFLQYLEGEKDTVLALMSRIFVDINHKNVRVILTKPVSGYSFVDWRMHSLNLNNTSWRQPSEYSGMREFIPFRPDTWQPWFVKSFITAMKQFDNLSIDFSAMSMTYDSIGFRELELKLSSDSLLFWLFLASMASTSFIMLLVRYDVVYS